VIYLDTNILISAIDEKDPLHLKALELLNKYNRVKRIISELTLVELASVYSRAGFEDSLAYALATIKSLDAEIIEIDYNKVLKKAFRYSREFKLKTLDLLHVVTAIMVNAEYFATFDKDIIGKKEIIRKYGLTIVTL